MSETRKIAAILVSDVVGYSEARRGGRRSHAFAAARAAQRSDRSGDRRASRPHRQAAPATAASSSSAASVDAVRCAIEVQNGMVERNAGLPQERRNRLPHRAFTWATSSRRAMAT